MFLFEMEDRTYSLVNWREHFINSFGKSKYSSSLKQVIFNLIKGLWLFVPRLKNYQICEYQKGCNVDQPQY